MQAPECASNICVYIYIYMCVYIRNIRVGLFLYNSVGGGREKPVNNFAKAVHFARMVVPREDGILPALD